MGSTSPITKDSDDPNYYDVEDPETDRIVIKLTGASGEVAITTKLTPVGVSSTSVSDYDKSISEWTVSDGTIAEKPELQSVVIDGRTVKFDATNQATFLCVEGRNTTVPEPVVTVDEMKYTYEIINAETTDGGATKIVVSEKDNADVYTTYIVNMEEIPVPRSFEGMSSLQAVYAEASDEPEGIDYGHVAWKTIDGDVVGNNSRWTSIGMGQWLLVELEQKSVVDNMMIMFGNGHLRNTYFNVEVSTDGVNFVTVVPDTQSVGTALGNTEAFELVALGGVTAKYIRINCNGNSSTGTVAGWNNIREVVFTGNVIPEIILESTDTEYTSGSNENITIHCTGEMKELESVEVDGEVVDDSNYTVVEGSTIVILNAAFLETLSVGEHTVTLNYSRERSAVSTLMVNAKSAAATPTPVPTSAPKATPTSAPKATPTSAPTPTPTSAPTSAPTNTPSSAPTTAPSSAPTSVPTDAPTADDDATSTPSDEAASDEATVDTTSGEVATGDESNVILWSVILMLAFAGLILGIIYYRRARNR